MLDISCTTHGEDFAMFKAIINQGIDARLEAFLKSKFEIRGSRLYMEFHDDEIQILLRRLEELEELEDRELESQQAGETWEHVYSWIVDILDSHYGIEII